MAASPPNLSLVARCEGAPLATRTDDELMVLAAAGLVEAYGALVARHQSRVRGICSRICRSRAIGDEVAQECFLRLWRMRHTYEPSGHFKAFLYRLVENQCKNDLRGRARRPEILSVENEPGASAADQLDMLIAARRRRAVDHGLEKLPEAQRRAILLRFTAGLEYEQIAAVVGRSETTVRSRVFHGLVRLRRILRKEVAS